MKLTNLNGFFLLVVILQFGPPVGMAEPVTETFDLRLDEAIALALENNLDLAIQQESRVAAEARVLEAKGAFDANLSAGYTSSESQRPLDAEASLAADGLTRVRSESDSARVSVSGQTPLSTSYSVSANNATSADTFNEFDQEHNSSGAVTLTQPLLRGRGRNYATYGLRVAQRGLEISEREFQAEVERVALSVEQAYWDLLSANRALNVRLQSVRAAESLLDQVKIKVRVGTTSEAERIQAESGLAQRKVSLIQTRRERSQRNRNLIHLILKDLDLSVLEIVPLDVPATNQIVLPPQKALIEAFDRRPELIRSEIQRSNAEDALKRVMNEQLPQLDLEGSYGVSGLGGSFGDSVDEARTQEDNNWSFGLVYRRAWPNRPRKAAILREESALRTAKLQQEQLRRQVIIEISDLYDRLNGAMDQIRAGELALKYARLNIDNERLKFEVQKSTVHNLLLLESELLEAELSHTQARIAYQKILAELDRAKGTLLDRWGIQLDATR